jgi:hypothetical protein
MARRAGSADLPLQVGRCQSGAGLSRESDYQRLSKQVLRRSPTGTVSCREPAMLGKHDTHHGPNFHLEFLGSAFLGIWRHVSQQGRRHCHVAVGLADGDNAKLIGAIARHLERDRGRIRFVVLPVDDLEQSAKALEQGRADLAVIRSDIAIPQNGATNMIGSRTGSPAA